jgi:hypothetical protein
VERLILFLALGLLTACSPQGKDRFDAWNSLFTHAPARFGHLVTGLWIARYQEDPQSHRFVRGTAWGEIPEKLVPDGNGGYSVAVPLFVQSESSDGPLPDRFLTVLVRVERRGDLFRLVANDALPGEVVGWHDASARTLWFRGKTAEGESPQILWQFQGRY